MTNANANKNGKKNTGPDWCAEAVARVKEGSDGLWLRWNWGKTTVIALNPFVSLGGTIVLFGFIIFCATGKPGDYCMEVVESPDGLREVVQYFKCSLAKTEFVWWKTWVTKIWTWLYVITQDAWSVFAIIICFTKYGKIKCGPDDEPPEFTFFSYFAMIFSAGVAAGLFFYSVAEPIWHYEPCLQYDASAEEFSGPAGHCKDKANRYSMNPDNVRAQQAMHLTLYHWGVHGWICYSLVGCTLAVLHFRKGLPMTIKTALYPLFGMRVYGFLGDCLDIISVVGTTFGVCTTLGLATMNLNDGIKRRNGGHNWIGLGYFNEENYDQWNDKLADYKNIWDMATSEWKLENPWFVDVPIANMTNMTGNETIIGTMIGNATGNLTGNLTGVVTQVSISTAAFIADLIKNNNQEVIIIWIITAISTASLIAGLHYGVQIVGNFTFLLGCFLLITVILLDDTWYILNFWVQSLGYYANYVVDTSFYTGAFDSPEHAAPDGIQEHSEWMNDWTIYYWGWWIAWGPSIGTFLARISKGRTVREFMGCCVFGSTLFNYIWLMTFAGAGFKMEMAASKYGIDSCDDPTRNICREESVDRYTGEPYYLCSTVTRLSCLKATEMIPSLLEQYSTIGVFLCFLTLIACVLYFVASSDSGSLVDSMLASNGLPEPPRLQRFYWSFTEGAASSALLYVGRFTPQAKDGTLKALQAMSIAVGLPWTFLCSLLCISLWRTCQYETGDRIWGNGFKSSIIDIGITVWDPKPLEGSGCNFGLGSVDFNRIGTNLLNSVCPPVNFYRIFGTMEARKANPRGWYPGLMAGILGLLFYGWLAFLIIDHIPVDQGGYWTLGSKMGSEDTTQKISNRYGIFYGWHARGEPGLVVRERNNTDANWTMTGMTYYPDHLENIPVGEQLGTDGRYGVFGWFCFLLFVGMLTQVRNNVRLMYKLHGNLLEDLCLTTFFYPTVLTQVLETLELREIPRDPAEDDPYLFGVKDYEEEQIESPQKGKNGNGNGHDSHQGNGNGSHLVNGNQNGNLLGPDPTSSAMVEAFEARLEVKAAELEARLELKAAEAAKAAHKFSGKVMAV